MEQSVLGCNSAARFILKHLVEEIKTLIINYAFTDKVPKVLTGVMGPINLIELFVFVNSRPGVICWFPKSSEDLIDLVLLVLTLEQSFFGC